MNQLHSLAKSNMRLKFLIKQCPKLWRVTVDCHLLPCTEKIKSTRKSSEKMAAHLSL